MKINPNIEIVKENNSSLELLSLKVCYIIFSQTSQSVGGHYRSMKTHYISFTQSQIIDKESFIINFGKVKSPVFENLNNVFFFRTYFFFIFRILKLVRSKKPDVLHCYDMASLHLARIISIFYNVKILYTKCGGKNSKKYLDTPTVFFSLENQQDYIGKGNKCTSYLLPNRVLQHNPSKELKNVKDILGIDEHHVNFIRINRISPTYERIMDQSVELIRKLQMNSINAKLYIVGRIEEERIFRKYINIDNNVVVISDPELTHTASDLIPFFDMVIATGRGAMEAYSYGKPILCSTQNSSIPLLVDENNFQKMFFYNFSPRTVIPNIDEDEELRKIKTAILKKEGQSDFSINMFNKYFNIETVGYNYKKIYNDIKFDKIEKGKNQIKVSDVYYFFSKIIKTWF